MGLLKFSRFFKKEKDFETAGHAYRKPMPLVSAGKSSSLRQLFYQKWPLLIMFHRFLRPISELEKLRQPSIWCTNIWGMGDLGIARLRMGILNDSWLKIP